MSLLLCLIYAEWTKKLILIVYSKSNMVRAVIEDWNITTLTDTKIKMTAKNPTKETQWIDIPKENTLQKKGHTAMTQKTAMMTDTSKGLVQDHPTIAIDHINLIPKNIGTIENVLEASRE